MNSQQNISSFEQTTKNHVVICKTPIAIKILFLVMTLSISYISARFVDPDHARTKGTSNTNAHISVIVIAVHRGTYATYAY